MTTFIFIILIISISWNIGISQKNPERAGNIAINIGVFGTFWGILMTLYHFNFNDTENLTNNLMGLIGGLRFAFLTSVFGMGINLVFKIFFPPMTPDKEQDHYYYCLSMLPKIYEQVRDINLLIPEQVSSPIITELQELKELRKIEMGLPVVETTPDTPQGMPIITVNSWIEKNLANAFQSLRRDIGLIAEEVAKHPAQLAELNTQVEEATNVLKMYCESVKIFEEEDLSTTRLQNVNNHLNAIVGKASKLEKVADSLDALMLSILEHTEQVKAKKYRLALFRKKYV